MGLWGLVFEEGLGEGLGVEGLEVIRLFAEADEFYGYAEFLLDSDDGAAFAGAVEFRDDEAGEGDGLMEFAGLGEGVEAGGSIEHEQSFVGCAGGLFSEDAMEFLEFLHEVLFGVEAAGGIDDEGVGIAGGGSADGVVADGGGVGAVGAGDDWGMEAFAPEFELFDGGGAERIAGGEDGYEFLLLEVVGEFG
ncbi:MAG: hypothetical protein RI897_1836 [Verrucomicrobiota bacterium]